MRSWFIRQLGGYASAEDAIEGIRSTGNVGQRRALLTLAVKRLFSTIDADDVLRRDPASGAFTFEGKPLTNGEIAILRSDAETMLKSKLWRVLNKEIRYHANRKMFIESRSDDDLTAGKMLVYYISEVDKQVRKIAKGDL